MPHNLTIEDSDIRSIEKALDGVRFEDEHRMTALRCCETRDIQACPGSGKTTLLVAKLGILARKWRWKDRGILVLSHTNVARTEVQERLARIGGHKLLEYPHFIGTIQKFTNQFLALPHLRNSGITDYRIDNQFFGDRAEALLSNSLSFRKAYNFLERKPHIGTAIVRGLRYEGADLDLGCMSQDLPCSKGSDSGVQLRNLKTLIAKDGIFRYDDMFALAERYLAKNSWAAAALRYRFPWVLLDEMQDTDSLQIRLLELVFGSDCIVQRFGDINQAIFGSSFSKESVSDFPRQDALDLPQSIRYCNKIAEFAKPLTQAVAYQNLAGNSLVPSKTHTIFLFSPDTIKSVLPAFGDLLAEEYREGIPKKFRAKAIGARQSGKASNKDKLPFRIFDYHPSFDPMAATSSSDPIIFVEYAKKGRELLAATDNFTDGFDEVMKGYLEILRIQNVFDTMESIIEEGGKPRQRRYTKTRLLDQVSGARHEVEFKNHFFYLLQAGAELGGQLHWGDFCEKVLAILKDCLGLDEGWKGGVSEFCEWSDGGYPELPPQSTRANTYVHKTGLPIGDIEIEISTIHAAKGETHTATLVLDTFEKSHDLKAVLPFLMGSKMKITASAARRMKRTFVAMTRPREMLCLAIRRDHFDNMTKARERFENNGWCIKEV